MGAEVTKMCGGDADGDGIPDALEDMMEDLSLDKIIEAIMDALERGVRFAVEKASAVGGFLNNPKIHIPWPERFTKVKEKLEKIGFRDTIAEFVESLNSAAERAAGSAVDIFVGAIRGLSFDRAREILDGGADACTAFLREMCYEPLKNMFKPIVDAALEAVDVTAMWDKLVKAYNKILSSTTSRSTFSTTTL
ncbi:uncharacterized protein AMSG_07860 [Thecamonas trahens ATCC 50062]|uniref:Uncharacterized protein n=1 Tax=Thecamonas trahens ATCC 50062 TaxID=461836 RepID=A0A0L0DHE4_THETB|nr:hypothetical protein AMSG_07860 [Thecamonas trahens ATCC 50062]KNC51784.1 hypothetical protein AMSG_07860 [Thecamonas trahens ATCC 50062]|eukprot:XP_013755657.1 hypothetical protein AMSG_07860 [Thecamonas trahens ATCC 50062]